ncbi:hypothetical protein NNC19_02110 [Clostridium sp. SHJSY1]|uniref:hypothetical protein n=1 Tax=Clostridium sp. SHJSY1 TaxID=2942483 RepID=UPI002875C743|nr:hypothetical protein [Clostridium sp. SHJSY1]MDS0524453.1 hypothetical protein [Clostridium sp. SHJSY1]
MKKSKIITAIGIFIILTVVLSNIGKHSNYTKRIHFNSTQELLEELNSKPLAAFKNESRNYNNLVYSDTFNECLSKRKRITSPAIDYSKLDVKINQDKNTEEDRNKIINKYLSLGKNLKKFDKPEKIEGYNLSGTSENIYSKHTEKINMDVVMIDEGEGWVIDYFLINPQGDKND